MDKGKTPTAINEHFPGLMGPRNFDQPLYPRLHYLWASHDLGSLTVQSSGAEAVTIPVSPQGTRGVFLKTRPTITNSGGEVHNIVGGFFY